MHHQVSTMDIPQHKGTTSHPKSNEKSTESTHKQPQKSRNEIPQKNNYHSHSIQSLPNSN